MRAVNEVVMSRAGLERLVLPNVYAGRFACREIAGPEADCERPLSRPCHTLYTSLCSRDYEAWRAVTQSRDFGA